MSAAHSTPRKPPASSDRRPPSAHGSTPNRSPSRMAAATATTSANTPSITNRPRPVRNGTGTPVSARAAARKPASSGNSEAEEDAKAELQAKLDELQERLRHAESAFEESRKHGDVLQIKLDEALREQELLEESVHERTQRIDELESERKDAVRSRRELEQIYEADKAQAVREREESLAEKQELAHNMQRLKETLAQKELRDRTGVDDERRPSVSRTSSVRSDDASPGQEPRDRQFAPPTPLQRSDSQSSSRLVLQKDKVIQDLRLELAEAQIKLVELENRGGGTFHQLEKDMYDIKMQNARLMEENESFQLLLSEKTLNGDLVQSDLLRPPSHGESHSRPSSSSARSKPRTSLADELEDFEGEIDQHGAEIPTDNRVKVLRTEVNSLKDQNKALTLYINNIISRLLQHEQFEAILDKTPELMAGPGALGRKNVAAGEADKEKELPLPPQQPAPQEGLQPGGFLQRAGSVLRKKPARPTSQLIQPPEQGEEANVHQNPTTAPSIPLGRSASKSGHRRARSDWPAASVVTNMYKGPSPGIPGPLSPGLSSPSGRASYFTRVSSGGPVPTISEMEHDKENIALAPSLLQPDSKVSSSLGTSPEGVSTLSSNRNSFMSTAPESADIASAAVSSNPSSPPQSLASSGDKETRPTGAIMMGSKPRPLRLVREADEEKARKQANRASWFGGWAQAGAGAFGGFLPAQRGGSEGQQRSGSHDGQQP